MEEKNREIKALERLKELAEDRSQKIVIMGSGAEGEKAIGVICAKIKDELGLIICPDQIEFIEDHPMGDLRDFSNRLIDDVLEEFEELVKMCDLEDLDEVDEIPKPPKVLKNVKNKKVPRANYGFQGKGFTNKGKNYNMRRR